MFRLVARFDKGLNEPRDIILGVLAGQADSQAARAGWHGRRTDRRAEDPLVHERGRHRQRALGRAHDDRDDLRGAPAHVEPLRLQRLAGTLRHGEEPLAAIGLGPGDPQGLARGLARGGGQGGRVDERPGAVHQEVAHVARRRREPADAAERLRERAHAGGDALADAQRLGQPRPCRTEDARGVGLVEDKHATEVATRLGQLCQRREVAGHREDRVGHQESSAGRVAMFREQVPRRGGAAVRVSHEPRAREADGVVEAGVVLAVREHQVAPAHQRRDEAEVGHVAGREDDRGRGVFEVRQGGLKGGVGLGVPGEESAGPGAPSPAGDPVSRGLAHPGIVGQAEVVVRCESEDRPPADVDSRPGRRADFEKPAAKTLRLQVLEGLADEVGIGHGTHFRF